MCRLTFLELKTDQTHDASTTTPKSLVLRARKLSHFAAVFIASEKSIETRKTYRAVLSEPRVVIPEGYTQVEPPAPAESTTATSTSAALPATSAETPAPNADAANGNATFNGKKRPRDETGSGTSTPTQAAQQDGGGSKKKKKKNKGGA